MTVATRIEPSFEHSRVAEAAQQSVHAVRVQAAEARYMELWQLMQETSDEALRSERREDLQAARRHLDALKLENDVSAVQAAEAKAASQRSASSIVALDFETIREVAELTRRLARDDYARHLLAASEARGTTQSEEAFEGLERAYKATILAERSCAAMMEAQRFHAQSTMSMMRGKPADAQAAADEAAKQMGMTAQNMQLFADYAPRSKFFKATLDAAAKVDSLAGKVEARAASSVAAFCAGLAAVGERVKSFAKVVKSTPAMVTDFAEASKTSVSEAAAKVHLSLTSGIRNFFAATKEKVLDVAGQVHSAAVDASDATRLRAWVAVHNAASFVNGAKDRVSAAADMVDSNVRAGVGLGGSIIARVGAALTEGFADEKAAVQAKKAERSFKPR